MEPSDEQIIEQARFIFSVGKMIRDRMFRASGQSLSVGPENAPELSMSQVHAVWAAKERGEVTISELAEILGVSAPSASVMVDRLVEKGVLTRRPSEKDRRKVLVSLSDQAERHTRDFEEAVLHSFVDLIRKIGPETTDMWIQVLTRIKQVQEQSGQDSPS